MILNFGVRNFLSFAEGVNVSFENSKKEVNTLLCIKGANGSGKTNLLKAFNFLWEFITDSFTNKPDDKINVSPFYDSKETTDFFVEFIAEDEIRYFYELKVTKEKVIFEGLYKKVARKTPIFERKENDLKHSHEFSDLGKIEIRNNASIISTSHYYKKDTFEHIYDHFSDFRSNLSLMSAFLRCKDGTIGGESILSAISKYYYEDKDMLDFAKSIICSSDLGISDISIEKLLNMNSEEVYAPKFTHKTNSGSHVLPYKSESNGTMFLYTYSLFYYFSLTNGGLAIFDEIDMCLHPLILPLLLEKFTDKKINTKKAQLLFTTHNTGLMKSLGADKVFLLNKDENESYGYRVDECSSALVRKGRNIVKPYEKGAIGGVPKL